MKKCFVPKRFGAERLGIIKRANEIIADYLHQGYQLTLRQLYYQFISADVMPNTERSYKKLGQVVSEARLAGAIDWNAIEDRVRVPRMPQEWQNIQSLVESAVFSYRLPRWDGQSNYVELWVEKDALAGVLEPIASRHHITLMVNRGYSSQSAMFEASLRFKNQTRTAHNWRTCHLLYLGDHDPSGEDMVRDISERLETFGAFVEVQKVALTMAQVEQYDPPPNPAKMSDSRAEKYVSKHGEQSWEVDALSPAVLVELIESAIKPLKDEKKVEKIIEREETDKAALRKAAESIK